ncbi:MAG: hypothetical protein WB524_00835 [Acidobacteriaceae bacterium]
MKRNKDVQFSIEVLNSMLDRSGLGPEQKSALENALLELKGLRRNANPSKQEVYRVVRKVTELLFTNFTK